MGALGEEVLSELGPVCSHVRVRVCSGGGQNQEGLGVANRQLSAKGHFLL